MKGGAWCDYLFAPIRRPPATLPPLSLSLIRPTAAPSAPQSPSCHSGRPSDWKQSGLWWHNYSDPLTSRCCHNQALIRLLWASFSLQRRLIWASDGRVMGTGAGAAVRRSERAPASASLDIVCLSIIVTKSCLNLTLWKSHFLPFCFFCAFFSPLAPTPPVSLRAGVGGGVHLFSTLRKFSDPVWPSQSTDAASLTPHSFLSVSLFLRHSCSLFFCSRSFSFFSSPECEKEEGEKSWNSEKGKKTEPQ